LSRLNDPVALAGSIEVPVAVVLRLAIEALGVKHGGGATVLSDLLIAAASDARFERIYVFCSPSKSRQFSFPLSDKIVEVECPFAEGNKLFRLWWIEWRLAAHVRRLGCNVLVCLSGCGNGGSAAPHITMIQQPLPFSPDAIKVASFAGRLRLRGLRSAMKRSCKSSRRVIVQTQTMKKVVSDAFSLSLDRIAVIAPGTRKVAAPESPSGALPAMRSARRGLRVLYVGSQSPYKNVALLLQAAERLRARMPELSIFLTWPTDDPVSGRNGVTCVGYLSGPELAEAYSLADAFVMPSLQETVGLPLLEAMTAGAPVIAADLPYAREVCGTAAVFFDPHDSLKLALCIEAVLTDRELRARLIAEGLRVAEARRQAHPYQQMLDEAVAAAVLARSSADG
jgi:glycosyltransferase involved in cell wall biosynthesis